MYSTQQVNTTDNAVMYLQEDTFIKKNKSGKHPPRQMLKVLFKNLESLSQPLHITQYHNNPLDNTTLK